ncbi:MAG TPA: choice-of-anchor E domain-containing protein [Verrucomicrobiota bacterium]|nr:choice-of-anchor E domain-containing protein [Verrucomicrobiota bacterium]
MNTKLLALPVALILPMLGNAQYVMTDTAYFAPTTVPFGPEVLSLRKFPFDPSILSRVTLEIKATLECYMTAENRTPYTLNARSWVLGDVEAAGPIAGLNPIASFGYVVVGPVVLAPADSQYGGGPDWTDFGGLLSATEAGTESTTDPDDFEPFLGSGTFPVEYSGWGGWAVWGVSNGEFVVKDFKGFGEVTVTYEYTWDEQQYGGGTAGFWSNKNGLALLTQADFNYLDFLCLVDGAGNPQDFGTLTTDSKRLFSSWLRARSASNMASQLACQLAAFALNVRHGVYQPTDLIPAPGCSDSGFLEAAWLIALANDALCADGYTPKDDPNRAGQELLKNALDNANNAAY